MLISIFLLAVAHANTPQPTYAPTMDTLEGAMNTTHLDQYNPTDYYISKVIEDAIPDFYLGHIRCPGPYVCVPNWIGNGHCDDCFGCDQYMVATGFFGDCSTCDYFWSGGVVGVGTFDGGDCGAFVFPESVNSKLLDECLENAEFRNGQDIKNMGYAQKRNTIIMELHRGGWGDISHLQAHTDIQITSKCLYSNIKECLKTNDWYDQAEMELWTWPDMRFRAAELIEDVTPYQSIELVLMSDENLLSQCIIAGMHQKIIGFGWKNQTELAPWTGEEKRNFVVGQLRDRGKGMVSQLQTLQDAQLRYLLNYI